MAADIDALRAARITNLTEPDLARDAVGAIRTPTLIYAGPHDTPEPKEYAAGLLLNASFVALDGLDHAQAMNRADLVLPHALAFLANSVTSVSRSAWCWRSFAAMRSKDVAPAPLRAT